MAASLDRLDRADGSAGEDPRLESIHRSLAILADGQADRAERIQLLFSRPYDAQWQAEFAGQKTER